jgi:hypothetical protein
MVAIVYIKVMYSLSSQSQCCSYTERNGEKNHFDQNHAYKNKINDFPRVVSPKGRFLY